MAMLPGWGMTEGEARKGTAAIEHVYLVVMRRYGGNVRSVGVQNCRRISGSSTWSQHAWGNAVDLTTDTMAQMDGVVRWLRANQDRYVYQILWRVANHFNHAHVDGQPYKSGTPPCAGGDSEQYDPDRLRVLKPLPSVQGVISGETWAPVLGETSKAVRRARNIITAQAERVESIRRRG